MYPVSDRFLGAIPKSGKRKIVADVYTDSKYVPILSDLPVIDGSLSVDRNSRSRRSGSLTLGDADLFPVELVRETGLEPYGAEIVIRCGFVYPDGTEELVPMGVFLITDVEANESRGRLPTIQFYDRAQRVYETSTHVTDGGPQIFVGQYINQALPEVVAYSAPGWPTDPRFSCTVDPALPAVKIPGGYLSGETDRWQICEEMATAISAEIYFNVFGEAIVKPPPFIDATTTAADAVWTVSYDIGDKKGVLVDADRRLTRESTYNAVVVLGATPESGNQPIGIAYNTASQSKTNWYGTFGKKTLRINNSLLTTSAQCTSAAQSELRNVSGLHKQVSFQALFNPALDAGDIVQVIYSDGISELHLIDSISFNFSQWSMSAETRTVVYT